jgi:hypothetical protein
MTRPSTNDTQAETLFKRVMKYPNLMTPDIRRYGKGESDRSLIYELSEGTGIDGEQIFGVTIVKVDGNTAEHLHEKSKLFQTLISANKYIKTL